MNYPREELLIDQRAMKMAESISDYKEPQTLLSRVERLEKLFEVYFKNSENDARLLHERLNRLEGVVGIIR